MTPFDKELSTMKITVPVVFEITTTKRTWAREMIDLYLATCKLESFYCEGTLLRVKGKA
jgi:hypothetical protein